MAIQPSVIRALEHLRDGELVIITGKRSGVVEGHLAAAAAEISADAINFMATHGRGVVCVALTPERCDALGLRAMASSQDNLYGPSVTVSIEAREGVSTGISAADRARTVAIAADPAAGAHDLVQPGHVFPLRSAAGGVLERAGRAEAGVDLARLAGLEPACAVCEILGEAGSLATSDELAELASAFGIPVVDVEDVVRHRMLTESRVEHGAREHWPTAHGTFTATVFHDSAGGVHVALVADAGPSALAAAPVLTHRCCASGELAGSTSCTCNADRLAALEALSTTEGGILILLGVGGAAGDPLRCVRTSTIAEAELAFGDRPRLPDQILVDSIVAGLLRFD